MPTAQFVFQRWQESAKYYCFFFFFCSFWIALQRHEWKRFCPLCRKRGASPKKFKFPYQGQASSIILFPFHSSNISIWFEAPCSIRRESPPSLVKWRCYLYCKNGLQYVRTQIMSRPAHVYMWIHFIMYFFLIKNAWILSVTQMFLSGLYRFIMLLLCWCYYF